MHVLFPHDLNEGPPPVTPASLLVCDALNMTFLLVPQLRKVERDKKTMDQEIVDLTNKLLDAKNTIDRLEELNVSAASELGNVASVCCGYRGYHLARNARAQLPGRVCVCVCRSATGRTATWPSSCSNATSRISGTTSSLM